MAGYQSKFSLLLHFLTNIWRFSFLLLFPNRYSSEDVVGDLVAGITVGLTVIPQALAYAGIAGLDPAVRLNICCFFSIRIRLNNFISFL